MFYADIEVFFLPKVIKSYFESTFNFITHFSAQDFGKDCSADRQILQMNSEQKEYIVKLHNRMRNKLALGEIPKYSSAAKMPAFVRIENMS